MRQVRQKSAPNGAGSVIGVSAADANLRSDDTGEQRRMNKEERQQLEATIAEVGRWAGQAKSIVADRSTIERLATEAQNQLSRALVDVPRDGATAWRVLPLGSGDDQALQAIARRTQLPLL